MEKLIELQMSMMILLHEFSVLLWNPLLQEILCQHNWKWCLRNLDILIVIFGTVCIV